jgi:hypothetical protein
MFQLFQKHVANVFSECCNAVCFKSILHMLQRSDGYCRGDKTLGRGRGATETERDGGWGATRDGAVARGGARRGRD